MTDSTMTDSTMTGSAASAPPGPDPNPSPFALSTKAVRVFAGIGLLFLLFACGIFIIVVLHQSYSGGASRALIEQGQWAMSLSFFAGLIGLCLPEVCLSHRARVVAVWSEYGLALAGPILAAGDFS
ncbi:hypothetical protein [Streptomyces sp. MST-110588]|uniref:hypothetical protein n=1 Tax=Streptomyces sp. MST-110588 TaxID=2833628 RepID=UPI001F5D76D2|nr:hypothetical protein [Streptomyces sp. MST-110588]UNO40425.1 hypothetical protein KGS77_13605 [Streptomyces sp. MST-110588]